MFFDGNDIGIDLTFFDKNAFDNMDKYNFQNSYNSKKYYDVNEGFLKGNMFVKEYKPYKNYQIKSLKTTSEQDGLLKKLMAYNFAFNDLNLYLDIYPEDKEALELFKKYVEDKGYDYYSICAPIMEGTKELMNAVWNKLQTLPPIKEYEVEEIPFEALVKDDKGFKITQVDEHYFLVEASWFPKVLKGIDIEDYEALQYMQRVLEKSGIFNALREKGIEEGDIVSLYDIEFEYVP
mgnify:CR=1 FL=1